MNFVGGGGDGTVLPISTYMATHTLQYEPVTYTVYTHNYPQTTLIGGMVSSYPQQLKKKILKRISQVGRLQQICILASYTRRRYLPYRQWCSHDSRATLRC